MESNVEKTQKTETKSNLSGLWALVGSLLTLGVAATLAYFIYQYSILLAINLCLVLLVILAAVLQSLFEGLKWLLYAAAIPLLVLGLLIYLLERLYYYHPGIVIAAGVIIGIIALIALIIWLKEEF